jgi:hypothetical protein
LVTNIARPPGKNCENKSHPGRIRIRRGDSALAVRSAPGRSLRIVGQPPRRATCVRNYTSRPRTPFSTFVARAYTSSVRWMVWALCRAGPVHCTSSILSALDPGTPLCKPVIAAWKSCGAPPVNPKTILGAREEEMAHNHGNE